MPLRTMDFESIASACSAIRAAGRKAYPRFVPVSRSPRRRKRLRRVLAAGSALTGVATYRKRAIDAYEQANADKLGLDPDPKRRPPPVRSASVETVVKRVERPPA